ADEPAPACDQIETFHTLSMFRFAVDEWMGLRTNPLTPPPVPRPSGEPNVPSLRHHRSFPTRFFVGGTGHPPHYTRPDGGATKTIIPPPLVGGGKGEGLARVSAPENRFVGPSRRNHSRLPARDPAPSPRPQGAGGIVDSESSTRCR